MTRLPLLEQLSVDPTPARPVRVWLLTALIVVALISVVAFPMPGWILARAALLGALLTGFFIARRGPLSLVGIGIATIAMGFLRDSIARRTFVAGGILGRNHWMAQATLVMWATTGAVLLVWLAVERRWKARIDPSAAPSSQ